MSKRSHSGSLKEEDEDSIRTELQELLRPLSSTKNGQESIDSPAFWEAHIGPYEQVLKSAECHMRQLVADKLCGCHAWGDPVYLERYEHPYIRTESAPMPDVYLWIGLFMNRATETRLRDENKEDYEICFRNALETFQEEVKSLPKLELARNILRYLTEEAKHLDAPQMLRFCATYGLSGAMTNVLQGKYHSNYPDDLTVDTPLFVTDLPDDPEERQGFRSWSNRLKQPVVVMGAALGYTHLVLHAIRALHADVTNGTTYLEQYPFLPIAEEMLLWAIYKNDKTMLRCLINDCGFQFRWVYDRMHDIYEMLFHIDRMGDEFGVWRADSYNPDEYMFDRRSQRRYRAQKCYHGKQAMLQTMIELGLPRELLVPEIDVSLDQDLLNEAKAEGLEEPDRQMCKDFVRLLSRSENKARNMIGVACMEYNAVVKKKDRKSLVEYYQHVLDMWKNQESSQLVCSTEFEQLDPRWRETKEKKKGKKKKHCFVNWWEKRSECDDESSDDDEEPTDIHDLEEETGLKLVHSESSDEGLE